MELNLFRWNSGRPSYPGTSTCGWGRGQCTAMMTANNGLYDYPASYSYGCICECKLFIFIYARF